MDIGGTFTDFVVTDLDAHRTFTGKSSTTPKDPSEGVLEGLQHLLEDPEHIEFSVHGTTVGLNAFLERRGTRVVLLMTEGLRDAYVIARGDRKELYSLQYKKPERLVPRSDVMEVRERLWWDGSVLEPLHEEDFAPIIERIRREHIQAAAVCFIHAYINPAHELRARSILKEAVPDLSVTLSHEVAREWREYERASTAVLNAYIAPIVERYLVSLEGKMKDLGVRTTLHVMESNGGVMTGHAARELPIQTLMSGPVGGSAGGSALSALTGRGNLLCVDMGGTSFDLSLIVGGKPSLSTETELEGLPVLLPLVDIHTIGAGGGSLAWVEAGALRVGPKSAGADPGPACYGRGGTEPTVTDANLYLKRLDPSYFLGGRMSLDAAAAARAIRTVAEKIGLDDVGTAEGILAIVNAKMADAMRTITVRQGIDPRDYALVAFGGAGPMHAVWLAEELQIREVIVPREPGTFSAWGMLHTDIRHDLTTIFYRAAKGLGSNDAEDGFQRLEKEAAAVLRDEHVARAMMHFVRTADMRYVGQEYWVNVPADTPFDLDRTAASFHKMHHTRYGHATPDAPIEFVNLRVAAIGRLEREVVEFDPPETNEDPQTGVRQVIFEKEPVTTRVLLRRRLAPGGGFKGPLIIEEETATTVVPPGWQVLVDPFGNILITREG